MSNKSKEFYKKEREKYRKSGDDFKKQLKICETNCKNDKQYKQQLQYELDIVNKKEYSKKNLNNKEVLKKMIKGNMLNKCSYKCLNDVPYPVAYGSDNVYVLGFDKNEYFPKETVKNMNTMKLLNTFMGECFPWKSVLDKYKTKMKYKVIQKRLQ